MLGDTQLEHFYGLDGNEILPVESSLQNINNWIRKYMVLW